MNIKHILIALILLCGIGSAYHDWSDDKEILYLYDDSKETINFCDDYLEKTQNPNKTVCVNATCISGWMKNSIPDAYITEYDFIYKVNDSYYKTVVVRLEQSIDHSTWFTNYVDRSLSIDGHEVASIKNLPISKYATTNPLLFSFSYPDRTVSLNEKTVSNQTLMFTEMDMEDQNFIVSYNRNFHGVSVFPIRWHFETVQTEGDIGLKLKGLSGILINVLDYIPGIGKSIGNIIYTPLLLIQYTFDFMFTFINLIIDDWWYALVLLEIMCIIPALQYNSYPELVGTYIDMHIKIINFMVHKVILPLIRLILKIIGLIRNMIPFI